jgi:hypothetical protein
MRAWSTFIYAALINLALLGSSVGKAQSCDGQELSKQFQAWVQHSHTQLPTPAENFEKISKLTSFQGLEANTSYMLGKDWPAKAGHCLILASLPVNEKQASESKEQFELDAVVFVMDSTNRIVASSSLLKNYLHGDGAFLTDVVFDTARYQLDKNTIAFGVRIGHQVGRWDTFGHTHLDLFFERQSSLLHALKSFPVYKSNHNKGIDCGAITEEFSRSLAVTSSKSEGLANLRVAQKSKTTSESASPKDPNTCIEKVTPEADRNTTLRFNGSHYAVPSDWKE